MAVFLRFFRKGRDRRIPSPKRPTKYPSINSETGKREALGRTGRQVQVDGNDLRPRDSRYGKKLAILTPTTYYPTP